MTLKEALNKIQNKEISIAELGTFYLDNIRKKDMELHSFLFVSEQEKNYATKVVDTKKPLFGIPYAVKDNILVKGMPATAGSKILENYMGAYNATVIEKLNSMGAFVLGKTNMDEFAMGSSTENSAYGATKNPYDTSRVPGGSSGGSAVAVAAELSPFALGSDTGGSIRQPAAFCGVVGFKPTYGAVSRYGLIAMASSLDQIGTFTRTVEDTKLVFSSLIGKDPLDSTSQMLELNNKSFDIKKLKIGIVDANFTEGLDERIAKKIHEALSVYKKIGATIKKVNLPYAEYGLAAYYIIMSSEASSNLARYDGIRYGAHILENKQKSLLDNYLTIRGEKFGREVLRRIMLGTYTLSAGYYDAYYKRAQKVRTLIKMDYEKAFREVDVIISPTTPTLPFKFGEKTENPLSMYLSDIYTVNANLAGIPAVSVPIGVINEQGKNLPTAMQIIGPQKSDFKVLDIAQAYEKNYKRY